MPRLTSDENTRGSGAVLLSLRVTILARGVLQHARGSEFTVVRTVPHPTCLGPRQGEGETDMLMLIGKEPHDDSDSESDRA